MAIAILGICEFTVGGVFGNDDAARGVNIDILPVNARGGVVAFIGPCLRHGYPPLITVSHIAVAHGRGGMNGGGRDPIRRDDLFTIKLAALEEHLAKFGVIAGGEIEASERESHVLFDGPRSNRISVKARHERLRHRPANTEVSLRCAFAVALMDDDAVFENNKPRRVQIREEFFEVLLLAINGDVFRQRLRGFWKDERRRRSIELLMKKRRIHIGEVLNDFIFVEQRIDRLKAFYVSPVKGDKCPAKQKRPKRDRTDYPSLSHSNSPSMQSA